MNYLEKIDWNILNEYIVNNLIIANKHPEYDIWILNYSPKVQYKGEWDEYTLSCRGLVIDKDGNILGRPFKKFKNVEEHNPGDIDISIPYEVFEKMDGSLIIVFYYQAIDKWIIASRGSFISEQALVAKEILNEMNIDIYTKLDKSYTYLFEVIYSENTIVVTYGNVRKLVLLTVVNTRTGIELSYNNMVLDYDNLFEIVKKYEVSNIKNLLELKKLEENNKEGFVVKFSNGLRVKVKFDEYVRLHRILTNVSNITIWEHLKDDFNFDVLLDRIPDEFYVWLKKTVNQLQGNYIKVECNALKEFIRIYYVNNITNRKEFAMEAIKTDCRSILFKIYEKKDYSEIIWKQIKPSYLKPFRDGYDI